MKREKTPDPSPSTRGPTGRPRPRCGHTAEPQNRGRMNGGVQAAESVTVAVTPLPLSSAHPASCSRGRPPCPMPRGSAAPAITAPRDSPSREPFAPRPSRVPRVGDRPAARVCGPTGGQDPRPLTLTLHLLGPPPPPPEPTALSTDSRCPKASLRRDARVSQSGLRVRKHALPRGSLFPRGGNGVSPSRPGRRGVRGCGVFAAPQPLQRTQSENTRF